MSIKHLYPTSTPALNLNPKSSRVADPRLSCVRNSIGTYVDPVSGLVKTAPANVARVEKGGLLVEQASTNAITQTVDFTAGSWSTVGSGIAITVNNSTAPDGTTTANKINRDGTSSQAYLNSGITTNTGTWTHSCFFKQGTHAIVQIVQSAESWSYANFDLSDGSTGNVGNASFVSSSIEEYADGWYRCTVKVIMNSGGAPKPIIALVPSKTSTYLPTTTINGYVYAWGFNSVNQDLLTSYIPASGSTVQRLADEITLTNSGIFNPGEFTTINEPFGVAGGSDTLTVVGDGEVAERTAVYNGHLTQEQTNTLAGKDDEWWEWRVVGSPFGWLKRITNGSIEVDWGDGSPIENLPVNSSHDFIDGAGYHTVRLRLGTSPYIGFESNSTDFKPKVVSIGPIPASMTVQAFKIFSGYTNLKTVDFAGASFMSTSDYGNKGFEDIFRDCSSLLSVPDIEKDSSVTKLTRTFSGCSSLTRLPLFDTSNVTTFDSFAAQCSSIKEVPLYDTSSVSNMASAFFSCTKLTSFPLLDTSGVTSFSQTWYNCVRLASFPTIDTSSGTNFYRAWVICTSLVSFPELDFSSGTTFREAWYQCSALTDFPANMFNTTGTLATNAFQNAWRNCALTAQSIENILVSLDANGATGILLGIQGGSNAAKTTWSTAANTAYNNLVTKSWSITFNP